LALVYAETHPERVAGLVIRSSCIMTDDEYAWLYDKSGSSHVFPEKWTEFIEAVPPVSRSNWRSTMKAYNRLLTSPNATTRRKAAKAWWGWESDVSFLEPRPDTTSDSKVESLAIIENHYFTHNAWLRPNQILKQAHRLRHIPLTIIHGRYDLICPFKSAYELHKTVPHSKLIAVSNAGHGGWEKKTLTVMKKELRKMLLR
jgi:proline iminopeptidase